MGYKIYRGGSMVASIVGASSSSVSYSDTRLSASSTYTYAVASYDASGNIGGQSNEASATTQAAPPGPIGNPVCDQTIKNVPGDYPSIQAAIDAASIGDTVKIAAGTYHENLKLKSGICLEGAGMDQTIISQNGASGIKGEDVSYVIIKNLAVKNNGCAPGSCGGGGDGGGIRLSDSRNITLQSCRISGNYAVNGGGMSISGSSVVMDHCLIDGNTASNVGGAIIAESSSSLALTKVTVAGNSWSNALGNGSVGGIRSYGSSLQITDSIVWGNTGQNFVGDGSGITNSDIGGWSGGTNNIDADPGFADDYHVQSGSPAAAMGLY